MGGWWFDADVPGGCPGAPEGGEDSGSHHVPVLPERASVHEEIHRPLARLRRGRGLCLRLRWADNHGGPGGERVGGSGVRYFGLLVPVGHELVADEPDLRDQHPDAVAVQCGQQGRALLAVGPDRRFRDYSGQHNCLGQDRSVRLGRRSCPVRGLLRRLRHHAGPGRGGSVHGQGHRPH